MSKKSGTKRPCPRTKARTTEPTVAVTVTEHELIILTGGLKSRMHAMNKEVMEEEWPPDDRLWRLEELVKSVKLEERLRQASETFDIDEDLAIEIRKRRTGSRHRNGDCHVEER